MDKFTTLTAKAAPMPLPNIDTDMIFPGRFLKTVRRTGLGKVAFYRMRFSEDGAEKPEFVLNQPQYRGAKILVTGDNFGCGSSREHAPWALLDFGIRCIISTSFADIFFNNAAKNGILCIVLPEIKVQALMQDAVNGLELTIDLDSQAISRDTEKAIQFDIEGHRKHSLLNGLDEISITLKSENKIAAFEDRVKKQRPWL